MLTAVHSAEARLKAAHHSLVIEVPPSELYGLVQRSNQRALWLTGIQPGATEEILVNEPPKHLALSQHTRSSAWRLDVFLAPDPLGTRVEFRGQLTRTPFFARLLGSFFQTMFSKKLHASLLALQSLAHEAVATGGNEGLEPKQ
jgi:hypothetical protein